MTGRTCATCANLMPIMGRGYCGANDTCPQKADTCPLWEKRDENTAGEVQK